MFGLDSLFAKAHLVSHLKLAATKWLLEPANPVMAYVPAAIKTEVLSELNKIESDAQKAVSTPAVTNAPAQPQG